MARLRKGTHGRYEGDQFPWGHCVVVKEPVDGLVVVELDHHGVVTVPVGDVTVVSETDDS